MLTCSRRSHTVSRLLSMMVFVPSRSLQVIVYPLPSEPRVSCAFGVRSAWVFLLSYNRHYLIDAQANEGALGFSTGLTHQFIPKAALPNEQCVNVSTGNNHLLVLTTTGIIFSWGAGE